MTDPPMNDPLRPDDGLVSSALDGEADAETRAQIDADPELAARLVEFDAVRRAVASPVPPVGAAARDAAIANAVTAATGGYDHVPKEHSQPIRLDERRARGAGRVRHAVMAGAAVLGLLAMAAGLRIGLDGGGSDSASTLAADGNERSDDTSAAGAGTAAMDLALGDIDDPATLATRVGEATGLGADGAGDSTAEFAEDAPAASAPAIGGDLETDRSVPAEPRTSEDCTIELIETRRGLSGQLAHGTVTYQGIGAYVFAYHDTITGAVSVVVTAMDDCRVLADIPL